MSCLCVGDASGSVAISGARKPSSNGSSSGAGASSTLGLSCSARVGVAAANSAAAGSCSAVSSMSARAAAMISPAIASTPTISSALCPSRQVSGVVAQVADVGLAPDRNWIRARLVRPGEPSRMLRATCPLIGMAGEASLRPCFFSLAKNSSATSFCQSRSCPSCDHSQAGRESSACCCTRRALGDVLQSSSMKIHGLRSTMGPHVPFRHNCPRDLKLYSI